MHQVPWMPFACVTVWSGALIFLTFSLDDLPLIGLLLVVIATYFFDYGPSWRGMEATTLMFGATLGKGARALFMQKEERRMQKIRNSKSEILNFLVGLIVLLAFASWWHVETSASVFLGPRWMGLWNNPNDYGELMGAGLVLAVGLLAHRLKAKGKIKNAEVGSQSPEVRRWNPLLRFFAPFKPAVRNPQSAILFVAAGMMAVGLLFSYSRGAWLGTAIGLLYLAKVYGKLKWRHLKLFLFFAFCFLLLIPWFFWNTPRTAPWYWQRLDMSRGSVQHRVAAWKAGFEMMWDHPFGVGWNKTVETYQKHYSPPEDGAAAITTNDYLMLGTQVGWPGLVCFVTYCALCFRTNRPHLTPALSPICPSTPLSNAEREDHRPSRRRARHSPLIARHSKPLVARVRWSCWWRFGLTADCSSWPQRQCFGFCLSWETKIERPKAGNRKLFSRRQPATGNQQSKIRNRKSI